MRRHSCSRREQERPFHNSLVPGILPSYLSVCTNEVINRKDEVIGRTDNIFEHFLSLGLILSGQKEFL